MVSERVWENIIEGVYKGQPELTRLSEGSSGWPFKQQVVIPIILVN